MSPIERELATILTQLGLEFSAHAILGPYELDIVLKDYKLNIECDGELFHSSPDEADRQARRDGWLRTQGFGVLHVRGKHIMNERDFVIREIRRAIRTGPQTALRRTEPVVKRK